MKQIPKATGGVPYQKKSTADTAVDSSITKPKSQVIEELGFTQKQAERFEILADNKDIVGQISFDELDNFIIRDDETA